MRNIIRYRASFNLPVDMFEIFITFFKDLFKISDCSVDVFLEKTFSANF